jgi:hypothetical protein
VGSCRKCGKYFPSVGTRPTLLNHLISKEKIVGSTEQLRALQQVAPPNSPAAVANATLGHVPLLRRRTAD